MCNKPIKPNLNLLRFSHTSILEQLKIEEALLRIGTGNWCILNEGSSIPAIVMGISGDAQSHIHIEKAQANDRITLIKRFSGGGTVVVDHNTCFLTLILEQDLFESNCPKFFLEWVAHHISEAFPQTHFALRENDFVLGDKKIGGNAQHFTKTRRLHHTSFLWDYSPERMALLKMPPKVPEYRTQRIHEEFVTTLKGLYPTKKEFVDLLQTSLEKKFTIDNRCLHEIEDLLNQPHRKALQVLDLR